MSTRKRKSCSTDGNDSIVSSSMVQPAVFDDDIKAKNERNKCDYSNKISIQDAKAGKVERRIRVYADGIFDLFHEGHARQLMQAKKVFSNSDVYLLAGVCNDCLTLKHKGKTVMYEDERYAAVSHCRYVDEVVKNAPWSLDDDFLEFHKIDFVAHDDIPYTTGSGTDVYAKLKARGMFVATQRTEGISTSDLVARIVRDYDSYVSRNLARGYSPSELNISFLRGQRLRLANKVDKVKEQTRALIGRKREEYMQKCEGASRDFIAAFLALFGGTSSSDSSIDGNHNGFWSRSRQRLTRALSVSRINSDVTEPIASTSSSDETPPSKMLRGCNRNKK